MMTKNENPIRSFDELSLAPHVSEALIRVGYEIPTPIQALTIPPLLAGRDIVGQAQTGTGKTAAFALPLLSHIDVELRAPQVLVLAPTRELAIQVSDSFRVYGACTKRLNVSTIYGGQDYNIQFRDLKRGAHIVVGTPGRVMDHLRRGTLKLDHLTSLVLDEADEMLRMGFIDDVEWILEQMPSNHQTALFSATMPPAIRRIAKKYLNDPEEVSIKVRTEAAETINQRYVIVGGRYKFDALFRILEVEDHDGVIVFVKTKTGTMEVAEKLASAGFRCAPHNGDIAQKLRERTVDRLKRGELDILVATDVAARGLDVERISHVINFDAPHDAEAYVHRVGRTGRAGRSGETILFVSPKERYAVRSIERATKQKIHQMELPSNRTINKKRVADFLGRVTTTIESGDMGLFESILTQYQEETDTPPMKMAVALATMLQGNTPLLLKDAPNRPSLEEPSFQNGKPRRRKEKRRNHSPEAGMELYRIEAGANHNVQVRNIVGAIANEADIDSKYIGHVEIYDEHSTVTLPEGMPPKTLKTLQKAWIGPRQLRLSKIDDSSESSAAPPIKLRPKPKRKLSAKKRAKRALKRAAK